MFLRVVLTIRKKFQFIDKTLKEEFVIRIKLSRNSPKTYVDEENKQRYLKLKDVKLAKSKRFPAACLIEYDDYHLYFRPFF
jgi:hypothetical protein